MSSASTRSRSFTSTVTIVPAKVDWRRTLAENRARIERDAGTCSGVRAAQRLAEALRQRPEDDGGILDGMLNIGASRIGHADWIEAIGERTGQAEFVTAAGQLRRVAQQWDVLMALHTRRRLGAEDRFAERKARTIPDTLVRLLELEADALNCAWRTL
jgi:hypothetical protein